MRITVQNLGVSFLLENLYWILEVVYKTLPDALGGFANELQLACL